MYKRFWHTPKISQNFSGEWNFCLHCYGQDENRTGYHSVLFYLFRGIFSQGTWQRKCEIFENSRKASRATQNASASHMRPAGRVIETPGLQGFIFQFGGNATVTTGVF